MPSVKGTWLDWYKERKVEENVAKGGGLVEAYPITDWKASAFGNVSIHGTASMFEKERFKVVAPFGSTKHSKNVLLRRTV